MNDIEFRCFLDLLMCSDPWPVPADNHYGVDNQDTMISYADKESQARGYDSWIDAYHRLTP